MNIKEEDIHRISHQPPSEIAKVLTDLYALLAEQAERFAELSAHNAQLTKRITEQAARIEELEDQVANLKRQLDQNSQNSHKPPSSDSFRKPTNLRKSGGKKGAPRGHPGHTLHQVDHPDTIVIHRVTACSQCSASLEGEPCEGYEKRQVFDLPQPRILVTEHRAERTCCPHCHSRQQAAFPDRVTAPAQYGESLTAWAVYLLSYQMLPCGEPANSSPIRPVIAPARRRCWPAWRPRMSNWHLTNRRFASRCLPPQLRTRMRPGFGSKAPHSGSTPFLPRNGRFRRSTTNGAARHSMTSGSSPGIPAFSCTTAICRISRTAIRLSLPYAALI